jgi:HlyD family secretion protein
MKKIKLNTLKISFLLILLIGFSACQNGQNFDAMGMFEANEIIVSAEANGEIKSLKISEGLTLDSGTVVGSIDCIQLELQKAQVLASMEALGLKQNEASPQVAILQQQVLTQQKQVAAQKEQLKVVERERSRFASLLAKKAVTQKQYDDIEGQSNILKKQIETSENQIAVFQQQMASQNSAVSIQNRGIMSEAKPLQVRLQQLDDQIRRCQITNPAKGTVISKYAENHEVTAMGKPLYKIADLSTITLRAYISNAQLSQIKLNQAVKIKVDKGNNAYQEYNGTLTWIADKAEFTPKSIQTKDERANLVYAIKVKVKNDGFLKIGMYGEVNF